MTILKRYAKQVVWISFILSLYVQSINIKLDEKSTKKDGERRNVYAHSKSASNRLNKVALIIYFVNDITFEPILKMLESRAYGLVILLSIRLFLDLILLSSLSILKWFLMSRWWPETHLRKQNYLKHTGWNRCWIASWFWNFSMLLPIQGKWFIEKIKFLFGSASSKQEKNKKKSWFFVPIWVPSMEVYY